MAESQTESPKQLPPHDCTVENAPKFRAWIKHRGGILIWESVNLSNPGMTWSTPALQKDDDPNSPPFPQPTWQCGNTPIRHVTREEDVVVLIPKEVKRFHVAVRRGGNGLQLKVTDGGTRRIRSAVAKAGEGAWYEFDYSTQEAVIFVADKSIPLNEWKSCAGFFANAPIDNARFCGRRIEHIEHQIEE